MAQLWNNLFEGRNGSCYVIAYHSQGTTDLNVMLWFLLFGAIAGVGLRLLSAGYILFWLCITLHIIYASVVLVTTIISRTRRTTGTNNSGHLTEYVVLSLVFDSGLVPGYWATMPWHRENVTVIILAGLLLASSIILARKTTQGDEPDI